MPSSSSSSSVNIIWLRQLPTSEGRCIRASKKTVSSTVGCVLYPLRCDAPLNGDEGRLALSADAVAAPTRWSTFAREGITAPAKQEKRDASLCDGPSAAALPRAALAAL
jgi:hypothetical protein